MFSCGTVAPNIEIRIDSPAPHLIPGEVQVRGANVFLGYYKNPEATAESFTADGWFRTGDVGILDRDGYLFLRGRTKCMILGASGQNIYPEEIEAALNNMPYVVHSLVIDDGGKLVGLVYPDYKQADLDHLHSKELGEKLFQGLVEVNRQFPNYSRIAHLELMPEDFEMTPKGSIKRYLYQRNRPLPSHS
jgi:long-chain acyl-CoA synthetase